MERAGGSDYQFRRICPNIGDGINVVTSEQSLSTGVLISFIFLTQILDPPVN